MPIEILTRGLECTVSRLTCSDPRVLTASELAQLASAFDRVRDPRDWKAPIESEISASERPLVEQAVLLFTNTEPTFAAAAGTPDRLVVRAPGYGKGPLAEGASQMRG